MGKDYPIKLVGGPFHGKELIIQSNETVPIEFVILVEDKTPDERPWAIRRQFTLREKKIVYQYESMSYRGRYVFVHEKTNRSTCKTLRIIQYENRH